MVRQHVARDELVLGGHRADDDLAALDPDAFQLSDPGEIDEMAGLGEP